LALDRDLLRELLGSEELRDLIDPDVLTSLEDELQRRQHLVATVDDLADLLRLLGPLRTDELVERHVPVELVTQLVGARQAIVVNIGGVEHVAAAQDAARLRDGLGVSIPLGLPAAFTDPVPAPLEELVARFARTHGPFETGDVVLRLAAPLARIHAALGSLESAGRVVRGEFLRRQADTQFVDVDVLAMLRRRSLAALRREIEPVEPQALARFLPAWQWVSGSGGSRRGVDAVVEAVAQLQGAPLMASTLDAEVLGSRVSGYREADLDQLCAAGDVVWIGAGASGARDGRLRLFFRDQVGLLAPEPTEERPAEPLHQAICEHLSTRGPSFWAQLVAAAPGSTETELLAALWDLVWAGVVTNDSFAPLRAIVRARGQAPRATGRPRPGRLRSIGPPSGAGRWSLVGDLLIDPPAPTARRHAQAMQLLERHGVLTREAVRAEQFPGGFAAVYGLLRLLEERGQVRRGYFVAGLGAAQFALPGAVDRLRERVEQPEYLVLAAGDPAQAYGAALAWPPSPVRPTRVASAAVVLRSGELVAWVDRSSHQLLVFDQADTSWAHQLAGWVTGGRWSTLEIRKFNGAEVRDGPEADLLRSVGFRDGYKGLVLRSR
jgi:ATP-dependent Lhr-like helicase